MSETKRKNTYLSLYEGEVSGQGPGLKGAEAFPDPGANFRSLAGQQEKQGAEVGHAMQEFAQVYDSMITSRYKVDEDVRADEMFREWQLQDSQRVGAAADKLYYENKSSIGDKRTEFIKASPLSQQVAADIFNKHAAGYLNWSMTYMQQQAIVADKESKRKAANNLVAKASKSPLTTKSIESMFQIADNLFYDEPELGEGYKEALTTTLLNANASADPAATANWVQENQAELIRIMGPDKAAAFTKQAEITSRQAMERNITNEMVFSEQKAAQKTQITRRLDDYTIELAMGNKELNNEELLARARDLGADYTAIQHAREAYYKTINTSNKMAASAEARYLLSKDTPLTEAEILTLQQAVVSGALPKAAYSMVMKRNANDETMAKSDLTRQLGIARSALRGVTEASIANSMGQYDILALEAEQILVNATQGKTKDEVIGMTDLSNPNSLLSTLRKQIASQIDTGSTNLNYSLEPALNDKAAAKARKAAEEAASPEEFFQKMGY